MKKLSLFPMLLAFLILTVGFSSCRKEKTMPAPTTTTSEIGINMKFINYTLSASPQFDIYSGVPVVNNKIATLTANNDGVLFISRDLLSTTQPVYIVNNQLDVYERLNISFHKYSETRINGDFSSDVNIVFTYRDKIYKIDNNNKKIEIILKR